MNRKYYLLIALMVLLPVGLLVLPELNTHQERTPEEMLRDMNRPGRYLSPDQVAERIIQRDPSMLLVDVRESTDYDTFSLEGAINIPVADMLDKENSIYLKLQGIDIVYFSNGDILAEKAWITAYRAGAENIYILKGGLNAWTEDILRPAEPAATASATEWEQYDFRRAAALYFKGGVVRMEDAAVAPAPSSPAPVRKPVRVAPHPQEEEVEGGC